MSVKIITDSKTLSATITKIATAGRKLDTAIHQAAVSCLWHAREHGDVTLYNRLTDAMPKGSRVKALHVWAAAFAPISVGQKGAALAKGWQADQFKLDEAEATPFWEYTTEKNPAPLTVEKLVAWLKSRATSDDEAKVTPEAREAAAKMLAAFQA
jgi:hypothetical protein